jgi:hypothetical protein
MLSFLREVHAVTITFQKIHLLKKQGFDAFPDRRFVNGSITKVVIAHVTKKADSLWSAVTLQRRPLVKVSHPSGGLQQKKPSNQANRSRAIRAKR